MSTQERKLKKNGEVQDTNGSEPQKDAPRPIRKPLFEYPDLPKYEMYTYWTILIVLFIYGWYAIYDASNKYQWSSTYGMGTIEKLPYFGRRIKDRSNYEWTKWLPLAYKLIPAWLVHCILFNYTERLFGQKYKHLWEVMTCLYTIIACCFVFDIPTMLVTLTHGAAIFTITRIFKSKIAIWLSTIPALWITLHNPFALPLSDPFYPLILHAYKLLYFISYNLDYLDGKTRAQDTKFVKGLFRMFYYAFYMPYLISLIVLYRDFERQLEERHTKSRDWKHIVIFGLRITFWFYLADFILHFFYFEAILYDQQELYRLSLDRLTAIGYAVGQFFHLKYVVIFGVPAFFAKLDNMQPNDGPICISRITLYSKIWRQFDRGLYAFFKEYIFLPIIRPTFSIWRKIFGVFVSYSFVLVWHGTLHNNIVWIVLNVAELFTESAAKVIYSIPAVRTWRESHISDITFRRILAFLHVLPFAFALYSNFYFLAGSMAGWVFADRIFWGETVTMRYPAVFLISLGYCFGHVCMDVDKYLDKKKAKQE